MADGKTWTVAMEGWPGSPPGSWVLYTDACHKGVRVSRGAGGHSRGRDVARRMGSRIDAVPHSLHGNSGGFQSYVLFIFPFPASPLYLSHIYTEAQEGPRCTNASLEVEV